MAKKKKYNRGKSHHHHAKARKGNPGVKHRYTRRRNAGTIGGLGSMVTNAAFVILGAIGSKLGAQMVLGTNNTGVMGYAGNLAIGAVMWFLASKFMHNSEAAKGVLSGTIVQILLRVLNDYTPFGAFTANLGMGDYQVQNFVTPQVLSDPMRNAAISIPNGWGSMPSLAAPAAAAPGAGNGMGNLYGGGSYDRLY